jgi:hypothetical protein
VNKGSGKGLPAGRALEVFQRLALGGLCGVGAVWTLTALWPVSRPFVRQFGYQVQKFAGAYPVVLLGLLLGVGGALLWQAFRKA